MAKKALTVGINDYRGIKDLRGCVNDVTNMRDILRNYFGFTNKEIRVLTDARATKANILERLEWLVKDAKAGDLLVFHFSGHGSQVRDRDGDELSDGMDELICPYDFDWSGVYITDDQLDEIFSKLPKGVILEVVLDCCHSGTGLRDISFGRPPELGPEHPTIARYLEPPIDIICRHEGEEEQLEQKKLLESARESQAKHVLWAACLANQTSADAYIKGAYNGAFTYYFCNQVRKSNAQLSRQELINRVRSSLSHNNYPQIPQLETDAASRKAKPFTTPKKKTKKSA